MVGTSISCILCRGSILYFGVSALTKFSRHMQYEHGATHAPDFMLAACRMNTKERKAIVEVFCNQTELAAAEEERLLVAAGDGTVSGTVEITNKSSEIEEVKIDDKTCLNVANAEKSIRNDKKKKYKYRGGTDHCCIMCCIDFKFEERRNIC